ncbi:PLC-like phosphodiesterase [Mycena epipterygia]|nr:PLC-like phosphodiesterase [Mycena epipterygia]
MELGDRSNWMRELKSYIERKHIYDVCLPGTHDSGTFDLSSRPSHGDSNSIVEFIAKLPVAGDQVSKWAKTQSFSFLEQLNYGVRFFDLRIGVSTYDQSLRIVHTLESNEPLQTMLEPIGSWIRDHTSEIVILDVQHLYGFTTERYIELATIFQKIFDSLLVPRTYRTTSTLDAYVSANKRVVILLPQGVHLEISSNSKIDSTWIWTREESYNNSWYPGSTTLDHLAEEYKSKDVATRPPDSTLMHGIGMALSPPESVSTLSELNNYATSSLKKWGPDKHNSRVVEKLQGMGLTGRGWVVSLDFIEVPDGSVIDYIIGLNRF